MTNLHRAGIEGTSKACWPEDYPDGGLNNCWNNSLDGLLDPLYKKPRSIWWAFKLYADMSGSIIQVTPQNDLLAIDGIASYNSSRKEAYILLGRYLRREGCEKNVIAVIDSIPEEIQKNKKIRVLIRKIPDTKKELLEKPVDFSNEVLVIKDNRLKIMLPDMDSEDVFSIILSLPE